jgi:hypothetical protein
MKRKHLLLLFACLVAVLLAGYVTLRLTTPSHRITVESFEAIQVGMTEKEVEDIIGVPAGIYAPGALTGLYGFDKERSRATRGLDRKPGKEWVARDVCIFVGFKDGRVVETFRGWPQGYDEPLLAKLRRWLGVE